jgi:hypothetical protein
MRNFYGSVELNNASVPISRKWALKKNSIQLVTWMQSRIRRISLSHRDNRVFYRAELGFHYRPGFHPAASNSALILRARE